MVVAARDHVKSWVVPKFDHRDASLVLYLPLWYQYSDMTGSTIYSYDRSRTACTVTGATWGSKGRTFDGTDDLISVASNANLNFGDSVTNTPFSWAIWLNRDDATRVDVFLGKDDATGREWQTYFVNTTTFNFALYDNIGTVRIARTAPATAITTGIWVFLVGTYDGTASATGIKTYQNATRVDTANDNAGTYVAMHNTGAVQTIGKGNAGATFFKGVIGDVLIYRNKVLTAAEILRIYRATKWRYV